MGEIVDQKFWLITFTSIVGLLIADFMPAISGPKTHCGGDQPEPHIENFAHWRNQLAVHNSNSSEPLITNLNSLNVHY